jgi:superfamily II DNA/RNA helicase
MSAVPTFAELGVSPELVPALMRGGIETPFPIQVATLPDAIAGRDILGRGQTGSGKTLAFGLGLLTRLAGRRAQPKRPLGLVLVPTRELAMQVSDTLSPLAHSLGLSVRLIAGGMPYSKQIRSLERGVTVLVATPGRLVDLINRGDVDLSETSITVLDEADQMADMGFMPIVREILDLTKPNGQRLLFSATLDGDVDLLVRKYLRNAAVHSLQPVNAQVENMDHHVLLVHPADKDLVTTQIAARDGRTLFFVRTQAGADRLADHLAAQGVPVGALHGGKSQAVRTRTLEAFRRGDTPALVATDVAARGIHVDGISLVVHVDSPTDPKDYLHRAGRTARAGESGTVVTLASPKQQRMVSSLTKRAGVDPYVMRVRPGDQTLSDVTGARQPSGIPWEAPVVRDKSEFRTGGPRRKFSPRSGTGNGPGNFAKRSNDRARGKGRPAR